MKWGREREEGGGRRICIKIVVNYTNQIQDACDSWDHKRLKFIYDKGNYYLHRFHVIVLISFEEDERKEEGGRRKR